MWLVNYILMLKLDLGVTNFTKEKIQKDILESSIFETLKVLGVKGNIEISLVICGEKRMRRLNREFRGKDRPTDVLSFGFDNELTGAGVIAMGEIIICFPYVRRQAKKAGVSMGREMALLASHGTIHLFGIDHERSEEESVRTDNIQDKVLAKIFKK